MKEEDPHYRRIMLLRKFQEDIERKDILTNTPPEELKSRIVFKEENTVGRQINHDQTIDHHTTEVVRDDYFQGGGENKNVWQAHLTKRINFYNYSNISNLIVKDRTNIAFNLPSYQVPRTFSKGIYVHVIYNISESVKIEELSLFNERIAGNEDIYGISFINAVELSEKTVGFLYRIDDSTLVKHPGQCIYLEQFDVIMYIKNQDIIHVHPNSLYSKRFIENNELRDKGIDNSFFFRLENIISTEDRQVDFFLNFGEDVYKIPSKVDNTRPKGIYLTTNPPVLSQHDPVGDIRTLYFSEEEAMAKFALCRRYEEAIYETSREQFKRRMEEQERDRQEKYLEKKRELEELKLEYEAKAYKQEQKMRKKEKKIKLEEAELKRKLEKTKVKSSVKGMKMKDNYEERSHKRKDTTEILKFVPTVIGTALTVGTIATGIGWKLGKGNKFF